MFDVLINQDATLIGIVADLQDNNVTYNINIYYKVGSYVGSETTMADWTLLANTGNIMSDPAGNPTTLPLGGATLAVMAGTTYGFYLENPGNSNDFDRHDGITTGNAAATEAIGTIFAGVLVDAAGTGSFSGTSFADRTWLGTLTFTTTAGNIPTLSEWGAIALGLLLVIFGVCGVREVRKGRVG